MAARGAIEYLHAEEQQQPSLEEARRTSCRRVNIGEGININRLFAMLKKYLLVMNKAYITMRVAASPDVDFEPIEPVCSLDAVFIA